MDLHISSSDIRRLLRTYTIVDCSCTFVGMVCIVRCGIKNVNRKDTCMNKTGLCLHNCSTPLNAIVNTIQGLSVFIWRINTHAFYENHNLVKEDTWIFDPTYSC